MNNDKQGYGRRELAEERGQTPGELGESWLGNTMCGSAINRGEEYNISSRFDRGIAHSSQICLMHMGALQDKTPRKQLTIDTIEQGLSDRYKPTGGDAPTGGESNGRYQTV